MKGMMKVKIALMGFTFTNSNKGCEALTYSFINMLIEMKIDNLEIYSFGYTGIGKLESEYPEIQFHSIRHRMKNPIYWIKLKRYFDQMDCIFDITFGDGFSDIYGKRWNCITDLAKQIAIASKTPFILLPQTYGPYYNRFLKKWALKIIKDSDAAFSRDDLSSEEINRYIGLKVTPVIDLAFSLPFNREKYHFEKSDKVRIGVNISGLLWNKGHSSTIKLSLDYQQFCRNLINELLVCEYEVHLIPHVIDEGEISTSEDDMFPCKQLNAEFPGTIIPEEFDNAIDAKSYISSMNVFIGARMHSTIGSFSSGVVTIPISYSKKFEGLFGTLNYPYVVSAVDLSTDEAIHTIMKYIDIREMLAERQRKATADVNKKLDIFRKTIKQYVG